MREGSCQARRAAALEVLRAHPGEQPGRRRHGPGRFRADMQLGLA